MSRPAIAIHGGAGTILKSQITEEKELLYRNSMNESINIGWRILIDGGSALDAVTEAVRALEDNPLFNAGKGSVFTSEGTHEMDAAIMDGRDLNAGAVALVSNVKNPILLARAVMEKTHHVLLCGDAAVKLAVENSVELADKDYFFTQSRFDQYTKAVAKDKILLDHSSEGGHGTVGAVAVDKSGNLAAATSTGGMTNKKTGRIGDSAIIGAGNYASNKTCAVSCTGQGEYFMRGVTAFDVSAMMEYLNMKLSDASRKAIHEKLESLGGNGGLIAIDASGNISMPFNSEGMYRACMSSEFDSPYVAIYKDEE
jgi:beta-aspartyl-peptidase (threonine type)